MKKISLLALAVPALFAACSQDELVTDVQNPQSAELLGEVAGDIDFVLEQNLETRMIWTDGVGAPAWEPKTDMFSLFWVGANGENKTDGNPWAYKAAANAVYQWNEEKASYQSQSVVYVGKHIIVGPADLTHVTDKEIVVKVGDTQEETTTIGNRTIVVSDLLNIKANAEVGDPEGTIYAGYQKAVKASVSPLSSNMRLDLNFKNSNEKVIVEKVELIAPSKLFVTEANLNLVNNFVSVVPTANGTTDKMTVNLPEDQKPTDNKLTVHISLLPPVKSLVDAAEGYVIKVHTNYGVVTIDKAWDVMNGSKYQFDAFTVKDAEDNDVAPTLEDLQKLGTKLGFKTEFGNIAERLSDTDPVAEGNQAEKSYGYQIGRTVTVDMSKADINGKEIATSQQLIDVYDVYETLGKANGEGEKAYFILKPATSTFVLTKDAADYINDKKFSKIQLVNDNVEAFELQNNEEYIYTEVPSFTNILNEEDGENILDEFELILGAGTWALNVQDAANFNAWKSITNKGTLTVSSAAVTPAGAELNKSLTNEAAVTFNEVEFPVAYTQSAEAAATTTINANMTFEENTDIQGGQLTIASGYQVYFNEATSAGDITVNGYLNAAGNFENNGKITNNGVVIIAAGGTFVNKSEMLVNKAANRTYINANEGTITIMDRQENLVISDEDKQGVIAYTATDENSDYMGNAFVGKAGDKFNKLTVTRADLDLTKINAAGTVVTSLVLDVYEAGKFEQFTFAKDAEFAEVVVGKENKGTLTYSVDFVSEALTIGDLTVMPNTELHVVPGSEIIYTGTAIDNQGAIAVGGIFRANNMMKPNFTGVEKKYKSAGYGGSFYWNNSNSVEDYLAVMLADASISEIVLPENVELASALTISRDVTLNLNGKTITSDGDALVVEAGGKLTINGNGTVNAGSGGAYNAVWANGGEVIIENGTFSVGADATGNTNDCIYAKGGTITINGGIFSNDGIYDPSKGGVVVNANNSIENSKVIVNDGTFPAGAWEAQDVDNNRVVLAEKFKN